MIHLPVAKSELVISIHAHGVLCNYITYLNTLSLTISCICSVVLFPRFRVCIICKLFSSIANVAAHRVSLKNSTTQTTYVGCNTKDYS